MIKVLFICHGNICRSPMAEFIFKDMVKKAGREQEFEIASAATSREELGNPVYPPARRKLHEHGISCAGKTARQITDADIEYYDYLLLMDDNNIRNLRRFCGGVLPQNAAKLLSFAGSSRDIADPWYTGNFDITYDDIVEGCTAFLEHISKNNL